MATPTEWDVGPIRTRVVEQPHEGLTYVERTQVNEAAILELNAKLRNMEQRKMDWGRQVAQIPVIALPQLYRDYPDLRSNDRHARGRALHKALLAHPEWLVVPQNKL